MASKQMETNGSARSATSGANRKALRASPNTTPFHSEKGPTGNRYAEVHQFFLGKTAQHCCMRHTPPHLHLNHENQPQTHFRMIGLPRLPAAADGSHYKPLNIRGMPLIPTRLRGTKPAPQPTTPFRGTTLFRGTSLQETHCCMRHRRLHLDFNHADQPANHFREIGLAPLRATAMPLKASPNTTSFREDRPAGALGGRPMARHPDPPRNAWNIIPRHFPKLRPCNIEAFTSNDFPPKCGTRDAVSQAPSPESNPNSPSPVTTMDQPGSIHQRLCSTCKCCHHERLSKTDTTAKCYSREPKNQRDSTGQTHQPAFAACTASKGTLDTCENASHYNSQLTHHMHPFRILQRPLEGAWMERVIRGT
ncbi:unnamed protein product [Lupinus luteus]|uniref:Uncharacterized protein n=1 Tax=Lupinus luteus TaxID=3873 RepID=A0AAV1VY06_LUPLU